MDFGEQLLVLQAAQGDPARLALATVDLAFPELPEVERSALKETLEAAAIPHWCDPGILSVLLKLPTEESDTRFARLRKLTVVEPFPARGESAVNVHEAARLALRKRLAAERPDQFRAVSDRAAAHFGGDGSPAGRIEWIYHRLCAAPEEAATELECLDREWGSSARPEDRQALAVALRELENAGLVRGRAQVWALLSISWARFDRGETAQLGSVAQWVLELSRAAGDERAEADAQCLVGDVCAAQGKLGEAQAAYGETLAINRQLATADPSNAGWQRELAVAHGKVGEALQAQGKLGEAQAAFVESLAISRRLAAADLSNAGWQRDLAVAHSRAGNVSQAWGKLDDARAAYVEALAIGRKLAAADPSNAGWQRGLAVAHVRISRLKTAREQFRERIDHLREARRIFDNLVAGTPDHPGWRSELEVVTAELAGAESLLPPPG